jgi:hypothetical protein
MSRGPAIFRQERCGLSGRRFVCYKFRSMVANAEELKSSLSHLNRKEIAFKIPDDPRLTPIGRYLRRFSLEELPQLWNVMRGDMSLVGPRPAVPDEVEQYQRWQRRRLRMRPAPGSGCHPPYPPSCPKDGTRYFPASVACVGLSRLSVSRPTWQPPPSARFPGAASR